ncbi:odorant receptor 4-like [Sitodiplosis mosellana]|uniref:odorant receptor 4-like n=1 Tax=Sitodiplosis mosellana TaxID=263140 RepID=UPI00244410A5|nr:odorant receptor 4-like [Sitodiplosis mosellana]
MKSVDFIKLPLFVVAIKGLEVKTSYNGEKAYYIVANWLLPLGLLNTMLNGYGQYAVMMEKINDGAGLSVYGRHVYPFFYIISLVTKLFTLLYKRRQLNKLLLTLDDVMPRTGKDQKEYRLDAFYNHITTLTRTCAIIAVFAINYASFSPTVVAYYKSKTNGKDFEMQYPYESYSIYPTQRIFFPIFFFSQVWESAINIGAINAINFMIYGIIVLIDMHYKHLAKKIISFNSSELMVVRDDHKDYEHLIWCVTKHNQLDGFIYQLNDIFSIASLVNLCCSTSIMVLFCFMGTNVASTNDFIQYLMNAFSSIVDLWVMCWFSQKIRNSSSFIPQSGYESIWYTRSTGYQKGIVMMVRNNQRNLHLEAFKFADLSMERFLSVIQLSYRILALLNNVEE